MNFFTTTLAPTTAPAGLPTAGTPAGQMGVFCASLNRVEDVRGSKLK